MLFLERIRAWKRERDIERRIRTHHTMEGQSIEKSIIGLSVLLEREISVRGSIKLTRPHLKQINDALLFHHTEMVKVITLGDKPSELPKELKEFSNEPETIWLDKFFMYKYGDPKKAIGCTLDILNNLSVDRSKLSKGMCSRFDHRIRKILKQLEVVVEHYIQLK